MASIVSVKSHHLTKIWLLLDNALVALVTARPQWLAMGPNIVVGQSAVIWIGSWIGIILCAITI
jgi:hypothetical protein